MKTILRRVGRLEDCYRTVAPKAALRVVVSSRWKGAVDWNTSTCRRTSGLPALLLNDTASVQFRVMAGRP